MFSSLTLEIFDSLLRHKADGLTRTSPSPLWAESDYYFLQLKARIHYVHRPITRAIYSVDKLA